MRIKLSSLRQIIQEELQRVHEAKWNVYKTKKMQRFGDPIQIDANSTDEAGKLAAGQFGAGTDPYTLDVEKIEDKQNAKPSAGAHLARSAFKDMHKVVSDAIARLYTAPTPQDLRDIAFNLNDAGTALGMMQDQFDDADKDIIIRALVSIKRAMYDLGNIPSNRPGADQELRHAFDDLEWVWVKGTTFTRIGYV